MENLNNDGDVVVHELGHHILYPYVSDLTGEAILLHEGTADFISYAVFENEDLGESILVGEPYLRSNKEVKGLLYDEMRYEWPAHRLGNFGLHI